MIKCSKVCTAAKFYWLLFAVRKQLFHRVWKVRLAPWTKYCGSRRSKKKMATWRRARLEIEAVEVLLYSRAMKMAQANIKDGQPISSFLIRSAHRMLLGFGRGAHLSPGEFKTEQNYLADRARRKILFVPISPELLNDGLETLFKFMDDDQWEILIRTALSHLEFEALHPFKDGNGRIGHNDHTTYVVEGGVILSPTSISAIILSKTKTNTLIACGRRLHQARGRSG